MERYGPCGLWFPSGYLSKVTGFQTSRDINPWLESAEGLRFRMSELQKRIDTMKGYKNARN